MALKNYDYYRDLYHTFALDKDTAYSVFNRIYGTVLTSYIQKLHFCNISIELHPDNGGWKELKIAFHENFRDGMKQDAQAISDIINDIERIIKEVIE